MRFNKQEMVTLATQPSNKFDKEGILLIRERTDGFFRKSEVTFERWCRLRGNLLFYFKTRDQWSEPVGVIILEDCDVKIELHNDFLDGYFPFHLIFENCFNLVLATVSDSDRTQWTDAINAASYVKIKRQMIQLQQMIDDKKSDCGYVEIDLNTWRLQKGLSLDLCEIPILEMSVACDNLLCDGHGRQPNPRLAVNVLIEQSNVWVRYSHTEILEEKSRLRIPLKSQLHNTVGFLTMIAWTLESDEKSLNDDHTPSHAPAIQQKTTGHRRSHSLPSRFVTKLAVPKPIHLKHIFNSPIERTYKFHSGLGGDIYVHELMAESRFCYSFPSNLLEIWIRREKELVQEISAMGELKEPWHSKQVDLLDRHLQLLNVYTQAKENMLNQCGRDSHFKASSRKKDKSLEFAPINLHLQRMWVYNDALNKSGSYDVITVGAFAAHCHKSKNGGLLKLLQQLNESNISDVQQISIKISMANDAIQAIKQLRKEVVDAMKSLIEMAKQKKTFEMLPICDDMISKSKILLSLWDPSLVNEAIKFTEQNKLSTTSNQVPPSSAPPVLSPFKRITQQLHSLNLQSPDMDDFATTPVSEGSATNWTDINDTENMCESPGANYYKPTDEPEPYDLTQLNIEASVICLVSKVKFLCGRCGSPAVRLRDRKSPGSGSKGNKFVEGLSLDNVTDWVAELKPSMRKLRQAMDGLLKTARLTHSVFRVQEDPKYALKMSQIQYRRDVCFSQALTAMVTALISKLWNSTLDTVFLTILSTIGPLASFEGLLSYYGDEIDMFGDMSVAIEDLRTVVFQLVRYSLPSSCESFNLIPKVKGCRNAVTISLPVPEDVFKVISNKSKFSFTVTPVFFNIGINESATIAESLGLTKVQQRSNQDNFERLQNYWLKFRKLNPNSNNPKESDLHLKMLFEKLKQSLVSSKCKNVDILHISSEIGRNLNGLRFTSCKSAKDRTGMAVTLEQCHILLKEYYLAENMFTEVIDCMRSEGCRRENTLKNTDIRRYAFNTLQLLTLPKLYRPPIGTYGSTVT